MKILIKYINVFIVLLAIVAVIGFSSNSKSGFDTVQPGKIINNIKKVSDEINSLKVTKNFKVINLFTYRQSSQNAKLQKNILKQAVNLNVNKENLKHFISKPEDNIVFRIPVSKTEFIDLELTKTKVFSDNAIIKVLSKEMINHLLQLVSSKMM